MMKSKQYKGIIFRTDGTLRARIKINRGFRLAQRYDKIKPYSLKPKPAKRISLWRGGRRLRKSRKKEKRI